MDENPYQASGGGGGVETPPDDWKRAAWCIMVVAGLAALSVLAVFAGAMAGDAVISLAALLVGAAFGIVSGLMFVFLSSEP